MTTITTTEDINATPAGFVGTEADGTVITRAIDGPGAVWRRAGSPQNIRPEELRLPITPLVPATTAVLAQDEAAVHRAARAILTKRSGQAAAQQAEDTNLSAWRDTIDQARVGLAAAGTTEPADVRALRRDLISLHRVLDELTEEAVGYAADDSLLLARVTAARSWVAEYAQDVAEYRATQ